MQLADVANYRTQDWETLPLSGMWLRFEQVPLLNADGGSTSEPWGLTCGSLAIHPVFLFTENMELDAAARFRVSARESGAAIADFRRLEIALGFACEIRNLDWSGGKEHSGAIAQRNEAAVLRAYRAWRRYSEGAPDA